MMEADATARAVLDLLAQDVRKSMSTYEKEELVDVIVHIGAHGYRADGVRIRIPQWRGRHVMVVADAWEGQSYAEVISEQDGQVSQVGFASMDPKLYEALVRWSRDRLKGMVGSGSVDPREGMI